MRKVKPFPGAFALVNISPAIGADPSEHISTIVAKNRVRNSPASVGPKRSAKSSCGINVRKEAAITVPNNSHFIIIFPSFQPDFRMEMLPAFDHFMSLKSALKLGDCAVLSSGLFGLSGNAPVWTSFWNIRPVIRAIITDPKI